MNRIKGCCNLLPRIKLLPALIGICLVINARADHTASGSNTISSVDLVIRGGTIYDGSGGEPVVGDVLVHDGRIVGIDVPGNRIQGSAVIDARGLAVAPGFINMLSWATESLLVDGRAVSDIKQGVTLEVFGEGWSFGPLNETMKQDNLEQQGDLKFPIEWTSLGEYLEHLQNKGISPNVASFVGAATVREYVLGNDDVDPDAQQLRQMRQLVSDAMQEGALGVGSSLIYEPGIYAETEELIALASEAARCDGMYISHIRSEGRNLLEAVDELIEISRRSGAPAEIYHMKQAGRDNWAKQEEMIRKIEQARSSGLRITADMYLYTAGATGLDAAMPIWVQEGGYEKWAHRLQDPETRRKVAAEMQQAGDNWENLLHDAGGPDNVLLLSFRNPDLKRFTGMRLSEAAQAMGASPEEAAMDLVIQDGSRVGAAYFHMSEENVRRQVNLPWMSFGSDAEAPATEGVFLESNSHPRAYGNVARLLGHYVRELGATTLSSAIHRLTQFPAENLGLRDRGRIEVGYFADIAVFDPATIIDHATFDEPAQYASGVWYVLVNGELVLEKGEPTGKKPGRVVRGPGWRGWPGGGSCR